MNGASVDATIANKGAFSTAQGPTGTGQSSPLGATVVAGLIEKISYLKQLGITAVELLPVFQFDTQDAPPGQPNYWGYSPISFFAPHQGYSSRQDPLGAVDEFRDMVKALHRADIEVILDVVFNHTTEGDHRGPTLCFRGLDNNTYYILDQDRSRYANYGGTGNSLNANHPVVRRMILDSLRYWVDEMHVDGFRFDLAAVLERDESGNLSPQPPVLWDIDSDPVLAGTKLIAEAWDAASHSLAFTSRPRDAKVFFHVMLNAYWEPLDFELPPPGENANTWRRWIDTGLESPQDIVEWRDTTPVNASTYRASPRSVVALVAHA